MRRLLTIVGARPQFIKAAAVSRALHATLASDCPINEQILHTGQHFDPAMSDQFFVELGIPEPEFYLGIGGGTHGANTGRMLEAIEAVLLKERPGAVLVYGDTDSTLAGALAASKLRIPVLHVEAGLRSFNRDMPEEQNRILTDHLSELCFAPTDTAVEQLLREGIALERIIRTGDVMADVARIYGDEAEVHADQLLQGISDIGKPFILATLHRAENTDNPRRLRAILEAMGNAPLPIVMPLHPRTQARISEYGLEPLLSSLQLIPPLGFCAMVLLERRAALVVTDSGGVQKEAFLQGTPCVTVRRETEWVELIDCGWNRLANPVDSPAIVAAMYQQLVLTSEHPRPQLYGDGHAADSIVACLQREKSVFTNCTPD